MEKAGLGRRPMAGAAVCVGVLAAAMILSSPRDASACGACYAASSETTVVNDHKMALAISKQRTILWDQIEYSGNPHDFAYVLPAKPGTRLEAAPSAWFAALDASTRPIIMGPQPTYSGGNGGDGYDGYYGEGASGGCCAPGLASSSAMSDRAAGAKGSSGTNSAPQADPVQVVEQAVVGPYETVTVRSTDADALRKWLVDHGYEIPAISAPIIASYVQNGFDFIALRLQPSSGERAIEPIRIVSPGADVTLPLRLMQIGGGAKVGITLYVIAEGRYKTKNFPDGPVDFNQLLWDFTQSRSNYQELLARAMASGDGRAFVTEYANKPNVNPNTPPAALPSGVMGNANLGYAYTQACPPTNLPPEPYDPIEEDAGSSDASSDASTIDDASADASLPSDAGLEDGGGDDASTNGTTTDAGVKPPKVRVVRCDDLAVAIDGLNPSDIWITRMRATLPNAALADTLVLEPSVQGVVDNVHQTTTSGTITASVAAKRLSWRHGTWATIALTAFVVSRIVRRRRDEKR